MTQLDNLLFNNTFNTLPEELYTRVKPEGLQKPFLVSANPKAATLIDLDINAFKTKQFVDIFSGNSLIHGTDPLAMKYGGHQFGSYNPELGDGRGLLLGEVESSSKEKWDLHLKGAGKTPYSRFGDGRAVLRSSIREYLCSEAIAALGIATTRGLCIIGSETPVYRESTETGAMLLRLAKSHIRFGHFEYFHYNQRPDLVKTLADYTIAQHFPDMSEKPLPYFEFFKIVIKRTAILIANWQAIGFAHGVMNTDNMSIIGDTFDYGPFGFMDAYNPGYICNHSDHQGRYAFNRQPSIGLWNLNALAHSLSSLIDKEQLSEALATYEPIIINEYSTLMGNKLGLNENNDGDQSLISELLELLQKEKKDYTNMFRALCYFDEKDAHHSLRDEFIHREDFDQWIDKYTKRLIAENSLQIQRKKKMLKHNPKYILRNYLAQQAIDKATQEKDFSEIEILLAILQAPYDEHIGYEQYAKEPPQWGKEMEISCSS